MDDRGTSFFEENEQKINEILCRFLPAALFVVPLLMLGSYFGLYAVPIKIIVVMGMLALFITIGPEALRRHGVKSSFLKYYSLISVSAMVGLMALHPRVGIWITYIFGAALSLLYFEPKLTRNISLVNYIIMMIAMAFRETSVHGFFARGTGMTIEFLLICPLFYLIAKKAREHLSQENALLLRLEEERERYRIAMENSEDVLYELDMEQDILRCYGSVTKSSEPKSIVHETKGITYQLQRGGVIHPEDVGKVLQFLAADAGYSIEIRRQIERDGKAAYQWILVSGNMVYEEDRPVRLIGKIRNITREKENEKELLKQSQKDILTGFYQKEAGLRLIEQEYSTQNQILESTVILLCMNNLSSLTGRLGEAYVQERLKQVAEAITQRAKEDDICVRLNSQIFLIWLKKSNTIQVERRINELETAISRINREGKEDGEFKYVLQCYHNLEEIPKQYMTS